MEKLGRIFLSFRLTHAAFDVTDVRCIAYKLKAVLIACDYAAVPAACLAALAYSTEQVVSLIALKFKTQYAHLIEHFLEDRHLNRQLLRHTLALSLIAVIALVSECGRFEVKCHAKAVRLLLLS